MTHAPPNGPENVTENDLHAWVDGRLDPARHALVEPHLDQNPAVRRRVEDWASQTAALRLALRQQDADTGPALLHRLGQPRPTGRWPALAAAAALLLGLGLGGYGGWTLRGDRKPTEISRLGVEAASAYRILNTGPGPAVEVSATNRAELRAMLTDRLGRRVTLPDLSAMGYRLLSGRVLAAIYGPAAMLVYGDTEGNRLTVYLQPMAVGAPAPMRPIQTEALNGYAWIEQKIGYTVMSEDGRDRLLAAAGRVQAENQP